MSGPLEREAWLAVGSSVAVLAGAAAGVASAFVVDMLTWSELGGGFFLVPAVGIAVVGMPAMWSSIAVLQLASASRHGDETFAAAWRAGAVGAGLGAIPGVAVGALVGMLGANIASWGYGASPALLLLGAVIGGAAGGALTAPFGAAASVAVGVQLSVVSDEE